MIFLLCTTSVGNESKRVEVELHQRNITNEQLAEMVERGEIPQNVTVLWLNHNQISDISPLSKLTELQRLYLSSNQISDLTPLSELINLTTLSLSNNQIIDISPLSNLTNLGGPLGALDLGYNQITDVTPLSELTKLQRLILSYNQITDLTPLESLKNVSLMALQGNPVTDEQIADLKSKLVLFRFYMGHILGGEEITILDALEILMYLAGLDSVIEEGNNAWFASLITGKDTPTINDALEILMHLAGLESVLG
jgi:Leucine-rich repeat (LRR) protein